MTKKAAVDMALREAIVRRERKKLRELFGQLEWSDDEMLRSRLPQSGRTEAWPDFGLSHFR